MARLILYLILLLTSMLYGQKDESVNTKATINTFFEGFHKGDTTLMKSVMMDNIILQTTYTNNEGKSILVTESSEKLMEVISNRPQHQKWDERLLDYNIQIDGIMANVWVPYEFWLNDTFSHCGVNNFQLFKDNGTWKIIHLIDTRRKDGCQEG